MKSVNVRILLVLLVMAVFSSCEKEYKKFDWISGNYVTTVWASYNILSDNEQSGILWVSDTSVTTPDRDFFTTNVSKDGDRIFFSFEYEKLTLPIIEVEISSIHESYNEELARFQIINNDEYFFNTGNRLFSPKIWRSESLGLKRFTFWLQEVNTDSDTLYRWLFKGGFY